MARHSTDGRPRGRSRLFREIACTLTAGDLKQRQGQWKRLGERAGVGAGGTADGLQLVFCATPGVEAELERLAALERECCGFATWSVQRRGGELVLAVSGDSEEGIAAVQEMFNELAASIGAAGQPVVGRAVGRDGESASGESHGLRP